MRSGILSLVLLGGAVGVMLLAGTSEAAVQSPGLMATTGDRVQVRASAVIGLRSNIPVNALVTLDVKRAAASELTGPIVSYVDPVTGQTRELPPGLDLEFTVRRGDVLSLATR